MKKPDQNKLAYLSCSLVTGTLNNGCGTSLGNLVVVYHHIVSNIFWAFHMDLQPEKD
jgi:hypothetical protein